MTTMSIPGHLGARGTPWFGGDVANSDRICWIHDVSYSCPNPSLIEGKREEQLKLALSAVGATTPRRWPFPRSLLSEPTSSNYHCTPIECRCKWEAWARAEAPLLLRLTGLGYPVARVIDLFNNFSRNLLLYCASASSVVYHAPSLVCFC